MRFSEHRRTRSRCASSRVPVRTAPPSRRPDCRDESSHSSTFSLSPRSVRVRRGPRRRGSLAPLADRSRPPSSRSAAGGPLREQSCRCLRACPPRSRHLRRRRRGTRRHHEIPRRLTTPFRPCGTIPSGCRRRDRPDYYYGHSTPETQRTHAPALLRDAGRPA